MYWLFNFLLLAFVYSIVKLTILDFIFSRYRPVYHKSLFELLDVTVAELFLSFILTVANGRNTSFSIIDVVGVDRTIVINN